MATNRFDTMFNELAGMLTEAFGNVSNDQFTVKPEVAKNNLVNTRLFLRSFKGSNLEQMLPTPFVELLVSANNLIDESKWDAYCDETDTEYEFDGVPECKVNTHEKLSKIGLENKAYAIRNVSYGKILGMFRATLKRYGLYSAGKNPFYYDEKPNEKYSRAYARQLKKEPKSILLGSVAVILIESQAIRGELLGEVEGLDALNSDAFEYIANPSDTPDETTDAAIAAAVIDDNWGIGRAFVRDDNTPDDGNWTSIGKDRYGNITAPINGQYCYGTDDSGHARPIGKILNAIGGKVIVRRGQGGGAENVDYRLKGTQSMTANDRFDFRTGAKGPRLSVLGRFARDMIRQKENAANGTLTDERPHFTDDGDFAMSKDLYSSTENEGKTARFQQVVEMYVYNNRSVFFAKDNLHFWVNTIDDSDADALSQQIASAKSAQDMIQILKNHTDISSRTPYLNRFLTIKASHASDEDVASGESRRRAIIEGIFANSPQAAYFKEQGESIRTTIKDALKCAIGLNVDIGKDSTQKDGAKKSITGQRIRNDGKYTKDLDWSSSASRNKFLDKRDIPAVDQAIGDVTQAVGSPVGGQQNLYQKFNISLKMQEKIGKLSLNTAIKFYNQRDYSTAGTVLSRVAERVKKLFLSDGKEIQSSISTLPEDIKNVVISTLDKTAKEVDGRMSSAMYDDFETQMRSIGSRKLSGIKTRVNLWEDIQTIKGMIQKNLISSLVKIRDRYAGATSGQDDAPEGPQITFGDYYYDLGPGNEKITTKKMTFDIGWSEGIKKKYDEIMEEISVLAGLGNPIVGDGETSDDENPVIKAIQLISNDTIMKAEYTDDNDASAKEASIRDSLRAMIKISDFLPQYIDTLTKIQSLFDEFGKELDGMMKSCFTKNVVVANRKGELVDTGNLFGEATPTFDNLRDTVFLPEYIRRIYKWLENNNRNSKYIKQLSDSLADNGSVSQTSVVEVSKEIWRDMLQFSKKVMSDSQGGGIVSNATGASGSFLAPDVSVAAWIFAQDMSSGHIAGPDEVSDVEFSEIEEKNIYGYFYGKQWTGGDGESLKDAPSLPYHHGRNDRGQSNSVEWTDTWVNIANDGEWGDSDESISRFSIKLIANIIGEMFRSVRRAAMQNGGDVTMDSGREAEQIDANAINKFGNNSDQNTDDDSNIDDDLPLDDNSDEIDDDSDLDDEAKSQYDDLDDENLDIQ